MTNGSSVLLATGGTISLAIGLIGPFVLCLLFAILMKLFHVQDGETRPSWISKLLGSAITAAWGLLMILPVVYMIALSALLVPDMPRWQNICNSVHGSRSFQLIQSFLDKHIVQPKTAAKDPVESLRQDPRIQDLMKDADFVQAVAKKDFQSLFSNPKLLALVQDPEFVKKALAAYGQMQGSMKEKIEAELNATQNALQKGN